VAMGALVLLPPLPPEPAVVRRVGQQCFGFVAITFVVRATRARSRRSVANKATSGSVRQLRIEEWHPQSRQAERRKRTSTKLRIWEREQMHEDIRELTAAGVYETRPVRGNGIDGDCQPGPCAWVACKFNLFITVRPSGAVKYNFPGKDIDEVGETCALRVAAKTAETGAALPFRKMSHYTNETYARVEQINGEAMASFAEAWLRMYPDDPPPRFGKE